MDVDSFVGVLLVLGAALLLSMTAACTAAGILGARNRSRSGDASGSTHLDHVHQFSHDRERLVSELVIARLVWLVTGVSAAMYLVVQRAGLSPRPVLLTAVAAVVIAGMLESIPRTIVARNPERWPGVVHPATVALRALFLVPAYLVDLPAGALLRLAAFAPSFAEEDDDEDLVRLVEMEESQGGIEDDERQMIRAVFELEETFVREVMVPRIDITAVPVAATLKDAAGVIAARGYSRLPLYEGSLDEIVGIVYAKDILAQLAAGRSEVDLREIARLPHFVPETKHVDELLTELRAQKVHIAIVVDEYGGTAGLVTIEDIVEEIIGEIEDEYDHAEPAVVHAENGDVIVDARESVYALKDLFDVEIEPEDFDTIGGLIIHRLGRIPAPNETVDVDGLHLRVLAVTGRRIRKVRISRATPAPAIAATVAPADPA